MCHKGFRERQYLKKTSLSTSQQKHQISSHPSSFPWQSDFSALPVQKHFLTSTLNFPQWHKNLLFLFHPTQVWWADYSLLLCSSTFLHLRVIAISLLSALFFQLSNPISVNPPRQLIILIALLWSFSRSSTFFSKELGLPYSLYNMGLPIFKPQISNAVLKTHDILPALVFPLYFNRGHTLWGWNTENPAAAFLPCS